MRIIKFLTLQGNHEIIGSAADEKLRYNSDVDVQEYVELEGESTRLLDNIYNQIRKKYRKALKDKNVFITDFKLGYYNRHPLHWTPTDIENGFIAIGNHVLTFQQALLLKSVIKMDIIYRNPTTTSEHLFKEYSINYYFIINEHHTSPFLEKNLSHEFIREYYKYYLQSNPFKGLKRIYSLLKHQEKPTEPLLSFLNSDTGKMYDTMTSLQTIEQLRDNSFRKPLKKDIVEAIKRLGYPATVDISKEITHLAEQVKVDSLEFIKSNINIAQLIKQS